MLLNSMCQRCNRCQCSIMNHQTYTSAIAPASARCAPAAIAVATTTTTTTAHVASPATITAIVGPFGALPQLMLSVSKVAALAKAAIALEPPNHDREYKTFNTHKQTRE